MAKTFKPAILGSDGGGNKILYILVAPDDTTKVLASIEKPTPSSLVGFEEQLKIVVNVWAADELGYDIKGVSLGFAGKNKEHQIMLNSPHMQSLNNVNVTTWLYKLFGIPGLVFNDLEILGKAERQIGALRSLKPGEGAIVITIGEGYGGCEVFVTQLEDRTITTVRPCEPGHATFFNAPPNAAICGCGNNFLDTGPCLEGVISGGAQVFQAMRLLKLHNVEMKSEDHADPNKALTRLAKEGVPWAQTYYKQIGQVLGWTLTNWLMYFQQATTIVYTGSTALKTMEFMKPILFERMNHPMAPQVRIIPTELGAEGAALGSVFMFEEYKWQASTAGTCNTPPSGYSEIDGTDDPHDAEAEAETGSGGMQYPDPS